MANSEEYWETSLPMTRATSLANQMANDPSSVTDVRILYSVGINPVPVSEALGKLPGVQTTIGTIETDRDTVDTNLAATESTRLYSGAAPQNNITNVDNMTEKITELGSQITSLLTHDIMGDIDTYNKNLQKLKVNTRMRLLQQAADRINNQHKLCSQDHTSMKVNLAYGGADIYYMYTKGNPIKTQINDYQQTETYYSVGATDSEGNTTITTYKDTYYHIDYDSLIPSNVDSWGFFGLFKLGDMKVEDLEEAIKQTGYYQNGYGLPYDPAKLRDYDDFDEVVV